MGANAQTSVPTFTAGEILTAANMNISASTGIPVFADSTARNAAFGGTGEKTLAEGQFAYLEDSNTTQYYDGASWVAVGASALTLISSTTIGTTVASVTVSSAFSATYDNYQIVISGGVGSANGQLKMTLGSTSANYYSVSVGGSYNNTGLSTNVDNGANFGVVGTHSTLNINANIYLMLPFAAKTTTVLAHSARSTTTNTQFGSMTTGGFLNDTTSYTAFTLTPESGTLTGGTIRVYGIANS
jgi:hypothetical protein